MVDNVIWHVTQPVQGTSRMEYTRQLPKSVVVARRSVVYTHSSSDVDVLSQILDACRLVEVPSSDTFPARHQANESRAWWTESDAPDHIPVCTARQHGHLLLLHDILQLTSHFARLAHQLGMEEVLHAPPVAVSRDVVSIVQYQLSSMG